MKIPRLTALPLMAAMLCGCAGPAPEPPPIPKAELSAPEPILSTDRVTDAHTAIHLGVTHCFPRQPEAPFQAELQKDHWFVWADFKDASLSADVAKSDGAVSNCTDLKM